MLVFRVGVPKIVIVGSCMAYIVGSRDAFVLEMYFYRTSLRCFLYLNNQSEPFPFSNMKQETLVSIPRPFEALSQNLLRVSGP